MAGSGTLGTEGVSPKSPEWAKQHLQGCWNCVSLTGIELRPNYIPGFRPPSRPPPWALLSRAFSARGDVAGPLSTQLLRCTSDEPVSILRRFAR